MLYWTCYGLVWLLFFLRSRFIVTGIENVPKTGSLILVSNHISGYDPIAVGFAVVKRKIRYMAKAELFRFFMLRWLIQALGAYPVKREEITKEFLKTTLTILRTNQALLIFGEGTRNRTPDPLLPLKPGFAYLAETAPAPVVPVYISGTNLITSSKIRPTIRIQFGELIQPGPKQQILKKTEEVLYRFASTLG